MNYLGAEPTRYQLKIQNLLIKYMLFEECLPSKGAMGDDQLCIKINSWTIIMITMVIPLLSRQLSGSPSSFEGGLYPNFRPIVSGN